MRLSVVMPTKNCIDLVRRSLPAVSFADEIIVVDMFSTDGTAEYAKAQPKVRFFQRAGEPLGCLNDNINFGIDHASGDWIYIVDSDEIPTPALANEIRNTMATAPSDVNGYFVPQRYYWCGKEVRYGPHYDPKGRRDGLWYRERFFRRGCARYACVHIHEKLTMSGKWEYLENWYDHYSVPSTRVYFEKANLYSDNEAKALDYSTISMNAIAMQLLIDPIKLFLHYFLRYKGYKDGMLGLIVCGSVAVTAFMNATKKWEYKTLAQAGSADNIRTGPGTAESLA
jgi:glycosyltransferase involved in cell wall biosynthesis